jgi:exodeoxyribonuclease VII large subunit
MQRPFDAAPDRPIGPRTSISVADLNREARALLERGFPLLWISGEVSGFLRHGSGHCYFTLKDRDAQVGCVMFRQRAQQLGWLPRNGAHVEVLALVTLYEPRGQFQLNVETIRRAGLGALFEAFEKLKAKLQLEGLFDPARKRPLPRFPRAVGVVTSREGAALRDFLTTLARRMPAIRVVIYPTPVQGDGAAERVAAAIRAAGARQECEVLVVCRGGGSIEDLWAFNDEAVARAIAAAPMPVVSGVWHETDFTIADFVADLRAPTPTAAAELLSPNRAELLTTLESQAQRLLRSIRHRLQTRMQQLDYLGRRLLPPGALLERQRVHLAHLARRLQAATRRAHDALAHRLALAANRLDAAAPDPARLAQRVDVLRHRLATAAARSQERRVEHVRRLGAQLSQLDPGRVLARGYSIARHANGAVVRASSEIDVTERLSLTFGHGSASVRVEGKNDT